ncbi:MAG: transposase [Anaeromyxobacter sp.]
MALPDEVRDEVEPLLLMFDTLNARIAKADADLEAIARDSAVVRRLTTAPGVGVVTAIAYDVVIDDPKRFQSAQQVSAYCGLVPSELSSGEKQRKGRITKTGNARVRWLLVQAAHCVLRSKSAESLPLREWAGKIHRRRATRSRRRGAGAQTLRNPVRDDEGREGLRRQPHLQGKRDGLDDRNRTQSGGRRAGDPGVRRKRVSRQGEREFGLGRSPGTAVAQMAPPARIPHCAGGTAAPVERE